MRNGVAAHGAAAPMPVRCAIYGRKSVEDRTATDFGSIEAQREACEAFVASQRSLGWTALPHRYDDEGFTGANQLPETRGGRGLGLAHPFHVGRRVNHGVAFQVEARLAPAVEHVDLGGVADTEERVVQGDRVVDAELAHRLLGHRHVEVVVGHVSIRSSSPAA